MRVILDANVLISYLLHPDGIVRDVLAACFQQRLTLLLPDDLLKELVARVKQKPYIAERIPQSQLGRFVTELRIVAERVAPIRREIPKISRDRADDYLIAYALVGQADYLVTGDKYLLALRNTIEDFVIATPRQLADLLAWHE